MSDRQEALERSQLWLDILSPIGSCRVTHTILREHARELLAAQTEIERLQIALKPFTYATLHTIWGGNEEGDASVVFARNEVALTIGDFRRAALAASEVA